MSAQASLEAVVSAADAAAMPHAAEYLTAQDWDAYSPEQHGVWATLVERRMPQLEEHAAREYLDGYGFIGLEADRIPRLDAVSERLKPRTAWRSRAVTGFLPSMAFFEMLAARQFPTTTWLRSRESLEYTPEPDIFHDVFGHVPMHAHRVFADFLQKYGQVCASVEDEPTLELLGRIFWYTVEFGVMRQEGRVKVYGSGLISSHGECTHVIGGGCAIRDFNLDEVLATKVKVDQMHTLLFAIESFDQIYEAMGEAERRLGNGTLVRRA